MHAYTPTVTPFATKGEWFSTARGLRTETVKWILIGACLVLKSRYLFVKHLKKHRLSFEIHIKPCAAAWRKMCAFGSRADGVWLGSSEQLPAYQI